MSTYIKTFAAEVTPAAFGAVPAGLAAFSAVPAGLAVFRAVPAGLAELQNMRSHIAGTELTNVFGQVHRPRKIPL